MIELKRASEHFKLLTNQAKESFSESELHIFNDITIRHNLHTLITISALDLLVAWKLYNSSALFWEKIFLLKKAHLTIHETLYIYNKRVKKLRDLVLENYVEGQSALFSEINKDIKEFKKNFDIKKISRVRNKVSAHIDENFDQYYETIMSIDPETGIKAVQSLISILVKCDKFLIELRSIINQNTEQKKDQLIQEIEVINNKLLKLMNRQKH